MAKKAELAADRDRYYQLLTESKELAQAGLYTRALEVSLSACLFADDMMQYERRFQDKEFKSVGAVDFILELAPTRFEYRCLDALEAQLDANRRIDRNATDDLAAKLEAARIRMWDAYRIWDRIESQGETNEVWLRQQSDVNREELRPLLEAWLKMGLVKRSASDPFGGIQLVTRMGKIVQGKCPNCGEVSEAPKSMFLEPSDCTACKANVSFVLLSDERQSCLVTKV